MKIPLETMTLIRSEREKRDHAAFMIGVATHEWRTLVGKSEALIEKSTQREQDVGTAALRACGLDPDAHEYSIMNDGEIVQLMHGTYLTLDGRVYDGL